MSDGISDMYQDERIARSEYNLFNQEKELIRSMVNLNNNEKKKKIKELMKDWHSYMNMRGGYWNNPSASFSKSRIALWGDYLEGKINFEIVMKAVDEINDSHKTHLYYAVGGHGQIMGNIERLVENALIKKYKDRPDSFYAFVDDEGRIIFEKVTCSNCPKAKAGCSISDRCRCKKTGELAEKSEQYKKQMANADIYITKYKLDKRN
jgi:hypothetical protein